MLAADQLAMYNNIRVRRVRRVTLRKRHVTFEEIFWEGDVERSVARMNLRAQKQGKPKPKP